MTAALPPISDEAATRVAALLSAAPAPLLPPEVTAWLENEDDSMPGHVGRAIDAIPDRTPAEIDAMMAADRTGGDALAEELLTSSPPRNG